MRGPKSTAILAEKNLNNNTDATKKTTKVDKSTAKKANKNSGAPERPPSALFVFMEQFRKEYKENFPENKSVSVVAKQGGVKWKAMSDTEKAPYVEIAAAKKAAYGVTVKQYKWKALSDSEKAAYGFAVKQFKDDLGEKDKSGSTSKSSSESYNDVEQEATSY